MVIFVFLLPKEPRQVQRGVSTKNFSNANDDHNFQLSFLQTDYHSVGSRANAYLELSVFIAQYNDYTHALIDHLTEKKVGHWDLHVRELAAKALNRLSSVAPSYSAESVMPQLLKNVSVFEDLYLKHGSILAIGELSLGLSNEARKSGEDVTKFLGQFI
jgi:hypothetical protein